MARDYDVGYGRPPRHTRFRKGQSGNPKGRPKGARSFRTELLEELGESVEVRIDGRPRRISKQRALIKQLTAMGIKGDARAVGALFQMVLRLTGDDEPGPAEEPVLSETDREILDRYLRSKPAAPEKPNG